jgi:hypothetical protein
MRKILVMIPAGEMYDHDCVRWYKADDVQRSIDSYHNIGDAFVHDSSLKILDYDAIDVMEIASVDQKAIDRYNAEYAYCFLRGSNYIHSSMRWQQTGSIIEKLKIPVIAFGVGAQAPAHGPLELSAETKRILHAIADRCETLGVRAPTRRTSSGASASGTSASSAARRCSAGVTRTSGSTCRRWKRYEG